MKRATLFITACLCSVVAVSQSLWDGEGGDGLWANSTNWVGDVVPGTTDDVVLNNVSGVPVNFLVTLPDTAVTIKSLRITPSGGNTIKLVLPASNTISPNAFVTTGTGYTIVLDMNAIFENNSGATSGVNLTIADSFRINNGGAYYHRTECASAVLAQKLARIPGTETGIFVFDVPSASYTISLSGRTYGSLIFSSTMRGTPVSYSGGGGMPLTIRGQLTISNNTRLGLTMSANATIHGDCIVSPGSIFNLQNSTNNNIVSLRKDLIVQGVLTKTGTGIPRLIFEGVSAQSVSVTGSLTNSVEWNINNPAGVVLLTPVILPYNLVLTNGRVTTTSVNILTIVDGMSCTGGSPSGFINGPMKKLGDDAFEFPVGEGSEYAPVAISAGDLPDNAFIAQYFRGNPRTVFGPAYENPPVNHMSVLEWWTIDRAAGTASGNVTLYARAYTEATSLAELRILRWDGAIWRDEGNTFFSGIAVGPVSSSVITNFFAPGVPTAFTFGSRVGYGGNPLPVGLTEFRVDKIGIDKSMLRWKLESGTQARKVELEKAGSDRIFKSIFSISVIDTMSSYTYTDNNFLPGMNQYRLKLIDKEGAVCYSKSVALMHEMNRLVLNSVSVNGGIARLSIGSSRRRSLVIMVNDMQGRMMQKGRYVADPGNTSVEFSIDRFAAGVYQVLVVDDDGAKLNVRFVKR